MFSYEHRQFASSPMLLLLVGLVAYLLYLAWEYHHPVFLISFVLIGLVAVVFHSLTVFVDREYIRVRFGIGWVRFKFALNEIVQCRTVRNRWWYGWGIRITPHGWLFNIAGLDAIEIRLQSGKTFRIGTDEPGALIRAIEQKAPNLACGPATTSP